MKFSPDAGLSVMRPFRKAPLVHLELHTGALPEAQVLLEKLFGWRAEWIWEGGESYLSMDFGGGLGGGIVECDTQRSLWLPYVEVDSIVAVTDQARSLGATVLLEPREGPAGWRSVVATTAAAELAFWQPKR